MLDKHIKRTRILKKNMAKLAPNGLNFALCRASARLRLGRSMGSPMLATIEPTNICDHHCAACPTGMGELERRKKSMTLDEFRRILDQFDDNLRVLFFYFMGESFLCRDAYAMIRLAADRGIYVTCCTNGLTVDPEELVRSGIAEISFQISGMSQETHAEYRVGGDIEKSLKNLRKTLELRRTLDVRRPYPMLVKSGFIVFRHNEHEVNEYQCAMEAWGVDKAQVVCPMVLNHEQGLHMLPTDRKYWIYDQEQFEKGILSPRSVINRNYCEWLYTTITIMVNGDVVPCCRDNQGRHVMGNIFKDGLKKVWNSRNYRAFRKTVGRNQSNVPLCAKCESYNFPAELF